MANIDSGSRRSAGSPPTAPASNGSRARGKRRRRVSPWLKRYLDAHRLKELPRGIAAIRLASGAIKFRASEPGGERGVRRWSELFPTLDEAKEYRELFLEERAKGVEPQELMTLAQLVELVEKKLRLAGRRPGTLRWFAGCGRVLRREFGEDRPVTQISPRDVVAFAENRAGKVGASSLHHYRRALQVIRKYGKVDLLKRVPSETWPKVELDEMHCFTLEETRDLLARIRGSDAASAQEDADLIALLFATGWRRAELARLTVRDVNLELAKAWIVGKVKREHVALSDAAVALLRRMIGRTDGSPETPVVRGGVETVARVFKRWSAELREPRLHAHACRHAFVSSLVAAGHDLAQVKRLSRHAGLQSLQRYLHAGKGEREALNDVAPEAPAKTKRKPRAAAKTKRVHRPRLVS